MAAKRISRRDFLKAAAGTGGAALLAAACGAAPTPEVIEKVVKETVVVTRGPSAAELVLIRYQSREPEMAGGVMKLWEDFYPQFREANPNIDVDFLPDPGGAQRTESAQAAMVAGNAPDLLVHLGRNVSPVDKSGIIGPGQHYTRRCISKCQGHDRHPLSRSRADNGKS